MECRTWAKDLMDQQLRQGLAEQSCEVTDLFAANAKCHIYCFFVSMIVTIEESLKSERALKGSFTIIVFYASALRLSCRKLLRIPSTY